jgi:hypothetical protein
MNRPLTTMLPRNAAPTRRLIVSDPDKLDYFARAALTRAGAAGTWGSFRGFGEAMPTQDTQSSDTTKNPGALDTVAEFARKLGQGLFASPPPAPMVLPAPAPSPVPMVLGVAALAVGGYALWRVMKKS